MFTGADACCCNVTAGGAVICWVGCDDAPPSFLTRVDQLDCHGIARNNLSEKEEGSKCITPGGHPQRVASARYGCRWQPRKTAPTAAGEGNCDQRNRGPDCVCGAPHA